METINYPGHDADRQIGITSMAAGSIVTTLKNQEFGLNQSGIEESGTSDSKSLEAAQAALEEVETLAAALREKLSSIQVVEKPKV